MELVENEKYYFDPIAAERPVKFIERYCRHYEGEFEGKPFKLMPYQLETTRNLFGWKRRDNGQRRFRELYMEIAKGNGKSPWLTAIGLYMLLADGEAAPHVISAATDFQQANVTFDFARKIVEASPKLAELCELKQFHIAGPKNALWRIVSGTAEGKHGSRPTCILMDEAHEWPNRKLYDNLTSNAGKRANSLILVATNAGSSRESICWELHERARKVLEGESANETLYPVIYSAPMEDQIGDVETWKKANPAYGYIPTVASYLETECQKARETPSLEARFRRLNLSQWVQGADKLIDMASWDACSTGFSPKDVRKLPLYVGVDLSGRDDLSTVTRVWVGGDRWYAAQKSWMPRATARHYAEKDAIPYYEWAERGHVSFLESATVDRAAQRRIARYVRKLAEKYDLKAVCYDAYRANPVISELEEHGITCVPVRQNWELSSSIEELIRRLQERSIAVKDDPCFRWQAANVEATTDKRGNIAIVKEAAKGQYTGRRAAKIDAIDALVNAVHQIRRQEMAPAGGQYWTGEITFV